MERFERAMLQRAILENARAATEERPSNVALAKVAGCDSSEITRFANGERVMDLDELVALVDEYGPAIVIEALRARGGGRPSAPADAQGSAVRILSHGSAFLTGLHDGTMPPAEALKHARAIRQEAADVEARLESAVRGRS